MMFPRPMSKGAVKGSQELSQSSQRRHPARPPPAEPPTGQAPLRTDFGPPPEPGSPTFPNSAVAAGPRQSEVGSVALHQLRLWWCVSGRRWCVDYVSVSAAFVSIG